MRLAFMGVVATIMSGTFSPMLGQTPLPVKLTVASGYGPGLQSAAAIWAPQDTVLVRGRLSLGSGCGRLRGTATYYKPDTLVLALQRYHIGQACARHESPARYEAIIAPLGVAVSYVRVTYSMDERAPEILAAQPISPHLLLGSPAAARAQDTAPEWLARMSLPRWVDSVLGPLLQEGRYTLGLTLHPFFQVGDFDRDQRLDAAVFVRSRESGKHGVLMLRRADPRPRVLGAGRAFGNGGDDFSWLDIWRVEASRQGDQLFVEKSESASGAITWDGEGYRWTQLGD